ncbi:MAG: type II toxin-antitoxin system VapC family toxin [Dehalococcoidia bacterium]
MGELPARGHHVTVTAVADTHAILWYFYDDPRLSATAGSFMDAERRARNQIALSSISLAEILYLVEKGRVPAGALTDVIAFINRFGTSVLEIPFNQSIALALREIPRADVPDMPDRIIAATSWHLGVPLISRDGRIRLSSVRTIW